jgi:hypothetical protein
MARRKVRVDKTVGTLYNHIPDLQQLHAGDTTSELPAAVTDP